VEFRVLGPFEVVRDGTQLELGGARQRALLAVLLLHRGEAVSIDQLIDALWGERPPATAAKAVQVYVSRLRKALGDGVLITRGGGYLLAGAAGQLDLDRFESIVSDGRRALEAGEARRAGARLREALALWRGAALADLAYEPFARAEIGRLEEEHLAALEDRIDADLAVGGHARLVGELDALVSEHPLRERLLAQLMLALYRSGRQADALERYRQARRRLVDELGIEPGQAVRELERAILAQDPALDAPASRSRTRPASTRARGGAWIAAGGALLLAAAIAAAAVALISSGAGPLTAAANSVAVIDPEADRLVAVTPVGAAPAGIAAGVGGVWVVNTADHTISNVDPASRMVVGVVPVGGSVDAVAADSGAVWTVDSTRGVASQVDPTFRSVIGGIRVGDKPGVGFGPNPVAVGNGAVWVANNASAVVRIADRGASVTRINVGNDPSGIAIGMGDIVGMPAFEAGRTAHLAGITVTGNRLQIRLSAPEPDLPVRIATPPFCATPDDTPETGQQQPIPSAGPYYIVSSSHAQLVLARNPKYSGQRPRVPQRIVYSFGVSLARSITQVEAGRSDYLNAAAFTGGGESALPRLEQLEGRYGPASTAARTGHQRYFVNPALDLEKFVFNTARPLFASARLRRAVNYAIDRRALVQHHFLFNGGLATDHNLVPGIPGSRPLDVYPLGGPDLAKARVLAGSVKAHATLYIPTGEPQFLQDAWIVQSNLKAIGITIDIYQLPVATLYHRLAIRGEPWDIAFTNWNADFPDPFTMINELYDPTLAAFNFGRFNDLALTRRMRDAARLDGQRRLQAYPARCGPDQKRPAGRRLGNRHLPRVLLRACRMPDLRADLRLRPREHLPSTLSQTTTARATNPARARQPRNVTVGLDATDIPTTPQAQPVPRLSPENVWSLVAASDRRLLAERSVS
jgi:DNA-binding SARP family transcriptional activator/ABC-type transport system substrate-binding protein